MSKDTQCQNLPSISLQDFLKISPEDMEISVAKFSTNIFVKVTYEVVLLIDSDLSNIHLDCSVQKRYTEFQGFYDSLTYRYQNLKFPDFPSKFQLVNTKESRKKFFDSLLKTVLKLAAGHPEIKKELLKILYEFMWEKNSSIEIKPLGERKLNNSIDMASPSNSQVQRAHSNSLNERSSIGEGSSNSNAGSNSIMSKSIFEAAGDLNEKSTNISTQVQPDKNTCTNKSGAVSDKRLSYMPYINDTTMIANMFQNDEVQNKTHAGKPK